MLKEILFLDLLKQIPGVIVDAQNNVSVNGVSGVRFLMDGRLQQMSTVQMTSILSGMSAETITFSNRANKKPISQI